MNGTGTSSCLLFLECTGLDPTIRVLTALGAPFLTELIHWIGFLRKWETKVFGRTVLDLVDSYEYSLCSWMLVFMLFLSELFSGGPVQKTFFCFLDCINPVCVGKRGASVGKMFLTGDVWSEIEPDFSKKWLALVDIIEGIKTSEGKDPLLSLDVGLIMFSVCFSLELLRGVAIIPDCVGTRTGTVVGSLLTWLSVTGTIWPSWVGTIREELVGGCGTSIGLGVVVRLVFGAGVDECSRRSLNALPRGEKIWAGKSLAPDSVKNPSVDSFFNTFFDLLRGNLDDAMSPWAFRFCFITDLSPSMKSAFIKDFRSSCEAFLCKSEVSLIGLKPIVFAFPSASLVTSFGDSYKSLRNVALPWRREERTSDNNDALPLTFLSGALNRDSCG